MKKALFLDRDGIINFDHGYVSKIEDFDFNDGIFELLKLFLKYDYQLFIVTNQSGIGRGYYTQNDFEVLTAWMIGEFKKHNIEIQSVHHCNHAPETKCYCRKPETGMIDEILAEHSIDLQRSWMIGDKQSDIDLAHNAKISHTIAIGKREITNATLSFKTILECKRYLEENQDIISYEI
ncbi:HAD family hydrolase [bacterium]|nr:HAD family hydrolase [bacterium]MBU1959036.1 HAD family hydrolase [bacterium]